ncbi:hypothetical protein ACFFRR_010832 [Megaselia abdita]
MCFTFKTLGQETVVQLQFADLAGIMFHVFFVLSFGVFIVIGQDLLLNLDCSSSVDCIQFQIPGSPNVTCLDSNCSCLDINHQQVPCKPRENKISNIIGGKCPCHIDNSECNEEEDICYCMENFTAIHGKRACVKETLNLGEICDNDSQCLKNNKYSECFGENGGAKMCRCQKHFVEHENSCISAVGLNETCESTEQCNNHTAHSKCWNKRCICEDTHVTSKDILRCLEGSGYEDPCTEDSQCIHLLGPGALCYAGVCNCDHRHFISASDKEHKLCELRIELGQYCREHNHCYQYHLNSNEQTMECYHSKCHCRKGFFHTKNNWECVGDSAVDIKASAFVITIALAFLY